MNAEKSKGGRPPAPPGLRRLQQERAALDGFLRLGNEKPRAKRLDAWIACLAGPNDSISGR